MTRNEAIVLFERVWVEGNVITQADWAAIEPYAIDPEETPLRIVGRIAGIPGHELREVERHPFAFGLARGVALRARERNKGGR